MSVPVIFQEVAVRGGRPPIRVSPAADVVEGAPHS